MTQSPTADGARILAAFVHPGKSHFQMHQTLISELIKHGHQVTVITAYTFESLKLGSNYTEVLIDPMFEIWKFANERSRTKSLYEMDMKPGSLMKMAEALGLASTEHALKQPKIQAIINANQTEGVYDLLLSEQFRQDAFLALAHVYKIPVVCSATFAKQLYMSQMFGLITPWSYVSSGFLPLRERMNFWQRIYNTYSAIEMDLHREFSYFPKVDALVQKYFGHLPIQFPSTSAMEKNLSAMFINNHIPLATVSPTMDNIVNVGGMHIYPPKPLPADLQKLLDEAKDGAIFFSLGTQVESKDMPLEKFQIFLDVFRQLKQRVLWKFENDSIPNLPANVLIKKWLPQNDILAHPNVRVFITHGGLFGTQEAVYHGVPVLGMPFFFDQFVNVMNAEASGRGISLDFHKLTHAALKNGLEQLIYNATYRDTAKRLSLIFRDRPMGPRETFLYWIDYVIRHNGARHLRAAGMDLKWYQFYLLDVAALVLAVVVLAVGTSVLSLRWIFRKLIAGKSKQKVQ
ncbi:UDP-glycosyltransferase UGT5-like [Rhagoletis pomonella]|uniref:UDP-glycosyltransferase UGT5-like n=1 Tax=Rhagoletis pomonella TaxID=28610 RepID=UPI00177AF5D4|nr:UDP-glycosyltransferase UGT5-like [Rhagoletis pomonella]